ncbi:CHAT domain-containing protein [Carboxylicivirga mesophila]|uniref:CHAT domain-containing protein n=1 Tax=Carboxylicivirga mesophila TaxID=1166478 RepID=A0ABS5KEU3_9BACT|nr:CHAT domain-containing protein [Carboxylicivirga mesophila]MBS2213520.1 CHAT domain-containing protein [Carboxylicivirga mesophila]
MSSEDLRPKDDERFRLLYKTIRSFVYAQETEKGYKFLNSIDLNQDDQLFAFYIKLYCGILSINLKYDNRGKTILNQLIQDNSDAFLVDSVKAKIYHNLSVIYGNEEQHALRLEYLSKSFELEKKTLLNNANYENYNLSVEVYSSTLYSTYRQYEAAYRVLQEALAMPFNHTINNNNHALYQNYVDLLLIMGKEDKAKLIIQNLSAFYKNKSQYFLDEYASLLVSLAYHYYQQNNYTSTILYATRALSTTPLNQGRINTRISANRMLAGLYYELQQNDKMEYYLLQGIIECKQTDKKHLANAYLSAGQKFAKIYEDDVAYAYIDSAKHLYYNQLNLPLNRHFENILALAYFDLGQYTQSLVHLNNVTKVLEGNSNYTHYLFWDNYYEKALCYKHLEQFSEANDLLSNVISEMLTKYPHLQDNSSTIQNSRIAFLYRKVNIALSNNLYSQYEESGDINTLHEAMASIEVAGNGLDLLRSKQNYDRDRLITGEMYYDFTLQSTKVAMALYNATKNRDYLEQAFSFIQKGKSYALLQGVADKNYKLNSGVPIEIINQLNHHKEQYDRYMQRYNEALFTNKPDSSLTNQLSIKMSLCMANIDSINSFIKKDFPQYIEEQARVPSLSLAETQERINKNQTVIDYYQTEDEIIRFVIDKDAYRCDIIKVNTDFNDALQLVLDELSTPFIGQHSLEHIRHFAKASYTLYNNLLKDLEQTVMGKELIIIPHSDLAYLPFESLLTEDVSKQKPRFKEYPWLVKTQTLSYAYNTALLDYQSHQPVEFNRVIAFAPEYCGKAIPDSIDFSANMLLDSLLPPLEGAQKEILSIEQIYTTKLFKGKAANKTNFIASMQDNDIIHLAMHSLNDDIQPFNSQIVFASKDSLTGSFTAAEIYNYSIKSPLTVLSSCSSGSGQKKKGEGLLSIARAFTFAGVESQVMTLWPVNDASGADITSEFYNELNKGIGKNKALQNSKLNYLSKADGIHSHPYYWANYVLSGNTNPIKQKMPKGIFMYLLAFAMLSVVILFIYDKKHSR